MLWLIYEGFFKGKIKMWHLIKRIKVYQWAISAVLLAIAGIFVYYTIIKDNVLFFIGYTLIAALIGIYLGYELNKIKIQNYGSQKEIFIEDRKNLKKILNEYKVTSFEQIDILIQEVDEILETLQISKNIEQKVNQIILFLSPFFIIFIEHFLEKNNNQALLLIMTIIMFIYGLYLIFKGPVKELLDSQYNKMKELKRYLKDIKIHMLDK